MVLQNPLFVSRNSRSASFTVDQSLRFRESEVAYLSRTPSSEGSRTTWTYSFWYKPGSRTRVAGLLQAGTVTFLSVNPSETNTTYAEFLSESDRLTFQGATVTWVMPESRLRDNSAWYHLVLICDTTNGTSSDRVRFYLNGERQTDFVQSSMPGSSDTLGINNTVEHTIGKRQGTTGNPLDGLLAEVNFLDGTAITETSGVLDEFGEYNSDGVWVPKDVSELTSDQYGLNGYRLVFNSEDGVGNDSAPTDGTHASANNWTLNNFDTTDVARYTGNEAGSTSTYESNSASRTQSLSNAGSTFDGDTAGGTQVSGGGGGYWYLENKSFSGLTGLRLLWGDPSQVADIRLNGTTVSWSTSGSYTVVDTNDIPATVTEIAARRDRDNTQVLQVEINTGSGFEALLDNTDNDVDYFDTPTRNYATYSPIINNDPPTLTSGNLDATAINNGLVWATQKLPNKRLYAEFIRDGASDRFAAGVGNADNGFEVGNASDSDYAFMIVYSELNGNASIFNENTTATQTSLTAYSTGDVLGVEWRGDLATRQVNFYINGTQVGGSENVAAGDDYYFAVQRAGGSNPPEVLANFGQMPYLAAPSGVTNTANGMQTNNLAAPTIKDGRDYFDVVTYEGNNQSRSISSLNFQPDLIWFKIRSNNTDDHAVYDSVRGAQKRLIPNDTNTEGADQTQAVSSFDSNGWTMGTDSQINGASPRTYVAWCWKAGGAAVSNTDGTRTSSVSANTDAGFSIVTFDGTSGDTIGHGLSQRPEFILDKDREDTQFWRVFHHMMDGGTVNDDPADNLHLNLNDAYPPARGAATRIDQVRDTFFRISGGNAGNARVAYCWHSVEGYSKFGTYEGNNSSSDGTYVYLGFRPSLIIYKNVDAAGSWVMYDTKRNTYNPVDTRLTANTNNTDGTSSSMHVDFLSNGFKHRNNDQDLNTSHTFVYCAWAENPFGGSGASPAAAF